MKEKIFNSVIAAVCCALAITFANTSLYADENAPAASSSVTPAPATPPTLPSAGKEPCQ